ncbi:hypothetical protein MIB92_12865 [Aestuariirhabdus sp. Z084]|uniref:hypothetical protein n=1 Tax=Aestuariirhabdus haliotis TaxID=2918751 RepID=UPI00201B3FB6|nr:hypothetical protein [Aestuariirhabdus haliotis]MCL6416544.1 hypothetical protein [Aestuariirhabdus haliotis]MCL6420534.1 hypothetical protein [Aestuariirhabdus haliotis]
MSKYLYTTVYEQFTGEKPPQPKADNERKARRTHGHPYRMRHNMRMQEQEQAQSVEHAQDSRKIERHPGNREGLSMAEMADLEARRKPRALPKIIYKKSRALSQRREYSAEATLQA